MLEVKDLSVAYGRVPALRGLSLHAEAGEIVGVIGHNGAGKTTTLKGIFGLVPVLSGEVTFEGTKLLGRKPEDIVREGIALVPEGRHIFQSLTVAENLSLGQANGRGGGEELWKSVLERFPVLRRYHDEPAGGLSGGEQQQLAIARALLSKPRLVLLDEPSLGLAPLMVDEVFSALSELRADGVAILLVEQNAARTISLADRTYVLRSGELAFSGTRSELEGRTDIEDAYLGIEGAL